MNIDTVAFSRNIEIFPPVQYIRLSAVSRIDFVDLTEEEYKTQKKRGEAAMSDPDRQPGRVVSPGLILKGKIEFRNGTIWDNIFFYPSYSGFSYKSEMTEGRLVAGKVKSITVNLKDAKECPECHRQYTELEWVFCPYDGKDL